MIQRKHPHPIYIVQSLSRYILLLLLPLARGAIAAFQGSVTQWLAGAWFDLSVLFLIFLLGFLRWLSITYTQQGDCLWVRKGLLIPSQTAIPLEKIITFSAVSPLVLRPLRAVELRADTPAGSFQKADFSLTVWAHQAKQLLEAGAREGDPLSQKPAAERTYQPGILAIAVLSVFTSNSLAGVLLSATFVNQLGQIAGTTLSSHLYGAFEHIIRILAFGVPPAAAAVAWLLFGGWLVAFISNLLRHLRFTVKSSPQFLKIYSGLFTTRQYQIRVSSIGYLDIRQSLGTKILGVASVFVHSIGYGKNREDLSVLIPASSVGTLPNRLALLLPSYQVSSRQLTPNLGALLRFLVEPLWVLGGLTAAVGLLLWLVPGLSQLIWWVGLMAAIPALWFLVIRIVDFATSGVSKKGSYYTLRYSSGFYLHTVVIPREKIAAIQLRQSVFQRRDRRCDLIVSSYAETLKLHRCKNLPVAQLALLFSLEVPKDMKQ